jgi:hypothetical protein
MDWHAEQIEKLKKFSNTLWLNGIASDQQFRDMVEKVFVECGLRKDILDPERFTPADVDQWVAGAIAPRSDWKILVAMVAAGIAEASDQCDAGSNEWLVKDQYAVRPLRRLPTARPRLRLVSPNNE